MKTNTMKNCKIFYYFRSRNEKIGKKNREAPIGAVTSFDFIVELKINLNWIKTRFQRDFGWLEERKQRLFWWWDFVSSSSSHRIAIVVDDEDGQSRAYVKQFKFSFLYRV